MCLLHFPTTVRLEVIVLFTDVIHFVILNVNVNPVVMLIVIPTVILIHIIPVVLPPLIILIVISPDILIQIPFVIIIPTIILIVTVTAIHTVILTATETVRKTKGTIIA
jgi:hypothetical protein